MSATRRARQPRDLFSRVLALAVVVASALVMLSGCASGGGGTSSQVGHYTVRVQTPMFRYGPAQSFGPDFSLAQGQHVIMLKKEFGYSRVMTDDGQSGYVASEDLVPAPPPPPPARTSSGSNRSLFARASSSRGSRSTSSANNQVIQSGPLFGEGELPPLPEADPLQPQTRPAFRVNVPAPAPGGTLSGASSESKTKPAETKSKPGFRVRVKSAEAR